jgi:hypothetical protein
VLYALAGVAGLLEIQLKTRRVAEVVAVRLLI